MKKFGIIAILLALIIWIANRVWGEFTVTVEDDE